MAIPTYEECYMPVLNCLKGGDVFPRNDIYDFCLKQFNLTEEERKRTIKSGSNLFFGRVGWAVTYLFNAGILERPNRGMYKISAKGIKIIQSGIKNIDNQYLERYGSFKDFQKRSGNNKKVVTAKKGNTCIETPIETIQQAVNEWNASLKGDLRIELMKMSPADFEYLVTDLVIKMGYGDNGLNDNPVTPLSGDEGIDGKIITDKFGFDPIYTQAKHWKEDTSIQRPEIQKFCGALMGHKVIRGVFVTTAHFSSGAIEYADNVPGCKIILIDGDRLIDLMIEYGLGVSTEYTYALKRIDSDYFER